jgi:predicted DNA-binding protein (UPF0251 family)
VADGVERHQPLPLCLAEYTNDQATCVCMRNAGHIDPWHRCSCGSPFHWTAATAEPTARLLAYRLSPQEIHALTIAAEGWPQTAAVRRFGQSDRTLRRALARAQRKLRARCLIHAVALAAARGLIHVEETDA